MNKKKNYKVKTIGIDPKYFKKNIKYLVNNYLNLQKIKANLTYFKIEELDEMWNILSSDSTYQKTFKFIIKHNRIHSPITYILDIVKIIKAKFRKSSLKKIKLVFLRNYSFQTNEDMNSF